jgi:Mg2+ and Co2+ transporter CorA
VIWTDSGCEAGFKAIQRLDVLPDAFHTEATSLTPVIDYKPNTGLSEKHASQGHSKGAEAAAQLCLGYGSTLHHNVMATNPLYALTEVFNLNTASLNQYLNLIELKLAGFTDDEHYADFDMLSNLRYSKDILYRQQRQIEQVIAWLRLQTHEVSTGWRMSDHADPKASKAAHEVTQRYEYLLTHVNTLQAQCQDAISNLMNNINLKGVKDSLAQSKRIGKLTFLAFFFAPLSFTTSFFAMNIGMTDLTLSKWLVTTFILIAVTFSFMFFDVLGWARRFWKKVRQVPRKARYF